MYSLRFRQLSEKVEKHLKIFRKTIDNLIKTNKQLDDLKNEIANELINLQIVQEATIDKIARNSVIITNIEKILN